MPDYYYGTITITYTTTTSIILITDSCESSSLPLMLLWPLQVISYDSIRGGVSVITEKGEVTISYLLIQNADLADSGKYSCSPSNADVASVRVHVLNGKTWLRYTNANIIILDMFAECMLSFANCSTIILQNLSALPHPSTVRADLLF